MEKKIELTIAETAVQFFNRSVNQLTDKGIDSMVLIKAVQDFDHSFAMEQLIVRYQKLIFKAFYLYKDNGFNINDNDLFSACTDGFMKAVRDYKGELLVYAFSTVAFKRMKESVANMIAEICRSIKFNRTAMYRIKMIGALSKKGWSVERIAKRLGVSCGVVCNLGGMTGSLNAIPMECDDHEKQYVSDEDTRYADVDEAITIMETMEKLDNSKMGTIMRKRLNGETFQSIADELKMDINKVQRSYKVGIVEIKTLLGM